MKFSENWLRTFVDPGLDSAQLAHQLTMAGLEVEAVEPAAPAFDKVVVAEILSAGKHPDADRLQVCTVDVGYPEPLTIVCGAANARAGLKTACALVGARLPNDFNIRQARVRGVESSGMLCSAKELGLAEAADGILELPADAPPGVDLRAWLDLDDRLLTLKLTPNRGDCLSLSGLAREVAAICEVAWTPVDCTPVEVHGEARVDIDLPVPEACPRYCGRVMAGLDPNARTPDWMLRRLERSGLRGIHPVVDITNYVMLELGQPMHAFDLDRLTGGIQARLAREGEQLELLNGATVAILPGTLLIADARGPLALAGIMGGQASAVSTESRSILLEAAHFTPSAIAGRARAHGLATDSAHRFERGVDPALPAVAIERASRLILDICGGQAGPLLDVDQRRDAARAITFRPGRARRLLGVELGDAEMRASLCRLGLGVRGEGESWQVDVPGYRFDLGLEVDLVEEVARLTGYDRLPAAKPRATARMLPAPDSRRSRDLLSDAMISRGYSEVITYSFISAEQAARVAPEQPTLALANPIASPLAVMRPSLLPGLLQALRHNLNHGQERLRLFELGRCFEGSGAEAQPLRLAGLAYGSVWPEQWGQTGRPVDLFDVKADIEALGIPARLDAQAGEHPLLHPGQCARLSLDGQPLGWLGTLHPRRMQELDLGRAPVLFELDWDVLAGRRLPRHGGVPRMPVVRRDIAVLVDEDLPAGEILTAVRADLPPLVTGFSLFDVYRGAELEKGKKSLAFMVLLQHTEKTLTDSEIDSTVAGLVARLQQRYSAVLRG